jgi:hypothetical protein
MKKMKEREKKMKKGKGKKKTHLLSLRFLVSLTLIREHEP